MCPHRGPSTSDGTLLSAKVDIASYVNHSCLMTQVTELAAAASGADARDGLRAALALRRLAETLEALQVDNARRQGWSWQAVADALEISKQAVHKKYARRSPARGSGEA